MNWETWGWYVILVILIVYFTTTVIYTTEDSKKRIGQEAKLKELESRLRDLEKLSEQTEEDK